MAHFIKNPILNKNAFVGETKMGGGEVFKYILTCAYERQTER